MASRKSKRGRNGPQVQTHLSAVKSDLDALQKDVRGLMGEVGGAATREVRGAVGSAAERIESWSSVNLAGVRDAVRSQPLKACAISVGAGAILGALLLR